MVDTHIHTSHSDGDKTVEEILKMCEDKKLKYISISDHNTCSAYKEDIINSNKFSGKIIVGVEMNANFNDKRIEILGYNIKNTDIIEQWSRQFFSEEALIKQQERWKKNFLSICDKKGLKYDIENIPNEIPKTEYITVYIYNELLRHKENLEILGENTKSFIYFMRNCLANPNSEYYICGDDEKPQYNDVIDIIHKAGGIAFIAHPYEYAVDDILGFIDELRNTKELDGIECFHPTSEIDNRSEILVKYARENNLYVSGGSDYHGKLKPDISIGIGKGALDVPEKYIEEWINI